MMVGSKPQFSNKFCALGAEVGKHMENICLHTSRHWGQDSARWSIKRPTRRRKQSFFLLFKIADRMLATYTRILRQIMQLV